MITENGLDSYTASQPEEVQGSTGTSVEFDGIKENIFRYDILEFLTFFQKKNYQKVCC